MEVLIEIFQQTIVAYSSKIVFKSWSIMDPYWNILPKIVAYSSKVFFKPSIIDLYLIQLSSGYNYILALLILRNLTWWILFCIMSNSHNLRHN